MTSVENNFAGTDAEAELRYRKSIDNDPLPEIPAALLNSSDVLRYVCLVGLIHPFDQQRFKAASYKVSIGDRFIYWDTAGQEHDLDLKETDDGKFCLEPNSIGFITTHETFRLPHYIAARFNLRINDVHRGLLLGTGPLVDPGFAGKLLVPLHNLTTNKYEYRFGDPIAWFEFTKLSPHFWDATFRNGRTVEELKRIYHAFPDIKVDRDPIMYLREAHKGPIRSSIPEAIAKSKQDASEARQAADKTKEAAEKAGKTFRNFGIGAALAGLITVGGLVIGGYQLVVQVHGLVADVQQSLQARLATKESPNDTHVRLLKVEQQLQELQSKLDVLRGNSGSSAAPATPEQ